MDLVGLVKGPNGLSWTWFTERLAGRADAVTDMITIFRR
jgi:hypothetical protein